MRTLEFLEEKTLQDGGVTYSLEEGLLLGRPFYAISLHKELEEIIPKKEFNADKIKMFIIKNDKILWEDIRAIGTWIYNDDVYLDVTTVFPKDGPCAVTEEELANLAYHNGQLAAWDLELNQEIKFQ